MAGFMAPGLGFASTAGAFIGGAAKQINQNIETENEQDRQDQILQQIKADKAISEYKKENKNNEAKVNLWNTIKDQYGEKAADTVISIYGANPKTGMSDLFGVAANIPKDENYKSSFKDNLSQQSQNSITDINKMVSRLPEKYRRQIPSFQNTGSKQSGTPTPFTQPAPNSASPSATYDSPAEGQLNQPPNTNGPLAGSGIKFGPAGDPSVPPVAGQNGVSPSLKPYVPSPGQRFAPVTEGPYADTNLPPEAGQLPDMGEGANTSMAPSGVPIPSPVSGAKPATGGYAQPVDKAGPAYTPQNTPPPTTASAPPAEIPPYKPPAPNKGFGTNPSLFPIKPDTQRQNEQTAQGAATVEIARQKENREARNAYDKQQFDRAQAAWDKEKYRTPEQTAAVDIAKKDIEGYYQNASTGLQKRVQDVSNWTKQAENMTATMNILQKGYKTGSIQNTYDAMNKFTQSVFGININDFGMPANSWQDNTEMKKVLSQSVIDQLKTLHFGRITNKEMDVVRQGMISDGNDPNTNLRIALVTRDLVRREKQGLDQEYNAAYPGGQIPLDFTKAREAVGKARTTAQQLKSSADIDTVPWPEYNSQKMDVNQLEQFLQKHEGQWVGDEATGRMLMWKNGKPYPAGANIYGG